MANRPCAAYPKCNKTIPPGERFCTPCGRKANRERNSTPDRKAQMAYYNSAAHKELRVETLAKDPFCRCVADYCSHAKPCNRPSTIADHIIPRERGGKDEGTNYQGLCKDCHDLKTNLVDGGRFRGRNLVVTLVCGPPGSGKTHYVMERFAPGDILVDFEQLMIAMTGLRGHSYPDSLKPLGWEAMDAVLNRIPKLEGKHRVWITSCAPRRAQRDKLQRGFKADVVVLEVSFDVCMSRLHSDKARDSRVDWSRLVESWWDDYEPCVSDERRAG